MANHLFNNGWIIVEANRVYNDMEANRGLVVLNDKWETMAVFDREGNLYVRGFVLPVHEFRPPTEVQIKTQEVMDFYGIPKEKSTIN